MLEHLKAKMYAVPSLILFPGIIVVHDAGKQRNSVLLYGANTKASMKMRRKTLFWEKHRKVSGLMWPGFMAESP